MGRPVAVMVPPIDMFVKDSWLALVLKKSSAVASDPPTAILFVREVRYVVVPPSVHFDDPAPMELSKSVNTCWRVVESELVNPSYTPIRNAPDPVADAESPIPILPMYRSDPDAMCISPLTSSSYAGRVIPIPTLPELVT